MVGQLQMPCMSMSWRKQLAVVWPIVPDAGGKKKRAEQLPRLIVAIGIFRYLPPYDSLVLMVRTSRELGVPYHRFLRHTIQGLF